METVDLYLFWRTRRRIIPYLFFMRIIDAGRDCSRGSDMTRIETRKLFLKKFPIKDTSCRKNYKDIAKARTFKDIFMDTVRGMFFLSYWKDDSFRNRRGDWKSPRQRFDSANNTKSVWTNWGQNCPKRLSLNEKLKNAARLLYRGAYPWQHVHSIFRKPYPTASGFHSPQSALNRLTQEFHNDPNHNSQYAYNNYPRIPSIEWVELVCIERGLEGLYNLHVYFPNKPRCNDQDSNPNKQCLHNLSSPR